MRRPLSISLAICIGLLAADSRASELDDQVAEPSENIEQALDQNREAIMALPHVVGAGIGLCGSDICIKVMVAELTPELMRQVEEILGQYPYAVEVTESLHPLPSGQHR